MARLRLASAAAIASIAASFGAMAACGSSDTGTDATGSGGTGGSPTTTTAPSSSSSSSAGGSGGSGGGGGAWVPTADDTQFHAVDSLPQGELIVFNDWNSVPSSLNAVPAAGGAKTTVFESFIVWDFAVAPTSRKIAFSSGFPDELQNQHYGTMVGNAIQPTWLYDPTTEDITLLESGNINDECHLFGPDEHKLYMCRRYDFDAMGASKGYRVGVLDLQADKFTFLTADITNELDLYPAVNEDENELLFTSIVIKSGKQTRSIQVEGLPPTTPTTVRANASAPVFSPDHSHFAYTDYGDAGALYIAKADGSGPVKVATEGGTNAVFSPDGTRVAFLVDDQADNCSHIDMAKTDGSEVDAPVRFRDCSTSGEFITGLAWVGP